MHFTKMHGLGNNYIYIDGWKNDIHPDLLPKLAIAVSDVHTGLGSDGLILILPSENADVKMRIFNKDGSEGKNCGNGLRCVAKYVFENNFVSSKSMTIETLSGIYTATIKNDDISLVAVNMGKPRLKRSEIPMNQGNPFDTVIKESFTISGNSFLLTAVSMGNPHAVFFVENPAEYIHLGPLIEGDKRFPERVNVEFVSQKDNKFLECLVWERGSGPTQACGTGACAALVAAVLNGVAKKGEEWTVKLPGGALQITWKENDEVVMIGPAVTIAKGIFYT